MLVYEKYFISVIYRNEYMIGGHLHLLQSKVVLICDPFLPGGLDKESNFGDEH